MGQLIIPNEMEIKGPWLLDETHLEELDKVLSVIDKKLIEDNEWHKNHQTNGDSYRSNKHIRSITLNCSDKKKLHDTSLLTLLKDPKLAELKPTALIVEMSEGYSEFKMEISSRFFDGDLEIRFKVNNDELASDINYELKKWINKYGPNFPLQMWSQYGAFPLASICFLTATILSLIFLPSEKRAYSSTLKNEAHQLLKDSISTDEINKAVQILLELETDFLPEHYSHTETNHTAKTVYVILFLLGAVLFISPRTVIGIGKNKTKVWIYTKWKYLVLVFIPLSLIIPILRSKLF